VQAPVDAFQLSDRPLQVKLAIAAAALAVAIDMFAVWEFKSVLGPGWILIAAFSVFRVIFVAFLLMLAYNGRGWVRYAFAVMFLVSVGSLAKTDPALLLDFWIVVQCALVLLAVLLWFTASSHNWYRDPYVHAS